MKKILTTCLCLSLSAFTLLMGQSAPNFWKQVQYHEIFLPEKSETVTMPDDYLTYALDFTAMVNHLRNAPQEGTPEARAGNLQVQLPMPNGTVERFKVWESSVMHPDLAARYPMIKTYAGRGIDNPHYTLRMGYGPDGFHAIVPGEQGGSMIVQYATQQTQYYICYQHSNFIFNGLDAPAVRIKLEGQLPTATDDALETGDPEFSFRGGGDGDPVERRDYRFALACTGEYGSTHGSTVAEVLSTLVTAANALNSVLERDADMRLYLHPNNDLIVFLDPETDPYNNASEGTELLGQNENVLNQILGLSNFDVGHVFTGGCSDVGGVVSGSVCSTGKARGVTCHFGSNVVATTLSIAAHEMGHQFTAGHTFNHCPGSEGQFHSGSAREPGSGSSILSYKGSCGDSNIPGPSNVMYNAGTIMEYWTYTHDGGGNVCAELEVTSNHSPVVTENYEDGFYIPVSTPFELEVSATDEDGDPLTYSWEQMNRTPSAPLGMPNGDSPTFRIHDPKTTPKRIFPKLQTILTNSSDITELLPTFSKNLWFRCVVRDNNVDEGAGGVTWQDVQFKATASAGPFLVTYPNDGSEVWKAGEEVEITWDVANTNNDLVKCHAVNIWISTNGGNAFQHLVATATPNDGSEVITVPDAVSANVRVRIEAANNIFFDLSNHNFQIEEADEPTFILGMSPQYQQVCVPDGAQVELSISSILGFDQPVELEILDGLPVNVDYSFSANPVMPGEATILNLDMENVEDDGLYEVELRAIAGTDTTYRTLHFNVVYNDFSDLVLSGPSNGSSDHSLLPTFEWSDLPQAEKYDIQIATSPTFETETILVEEFDLEETVFVPEIALDESTVYYWRIRPSNECVKADFSLTSTFQTYTTTCSPYVSTDIPKNISNIGLPTVVSTIPVIQNGTISDVNITKIKGAHDALPHLRVSVVSPAQTEVVLFEEICGNVSTFNLGLNDESPFEIDCPPLNGLSYKPQNPLSAFDGENTIGTWSLKVEVIDTDGQGGILQDWGLEFCASVTPDHPFVVTNDTLYVRPLETGIIHNYNLFADDPDNLPTDIRFTVVDNTKSGYLSKNGNPMEPGGKFSLEDINNQRITYTNTSEEAVYDFFTFTVTDGAGGLHGTPRFNIVIDENAITAVDDEAFKNGMLVFPNPASSVLNVTFQLPLEQEATLAITDLQGRVIGNRQIPAALQRLSVDLDDLPEGIYFLTVRSIEGIFAKKFVVQR